MFKKEEHGSVELLEFVDANTLEDKLGPRDQLRVGKPCGTSHDT